MTLPRLAAAAAFVFGVLGLSRLSRARTGHAPPPTPPPKPTTALGFRLTDVDNAPADLESQVPVTGVLLRAMPGPDRPDYWLARLDVPLRWMDAATERVVDHLVLAARMQGQSIGPDFDEMTVGVAYVVDATLLADAAVTFAKIRYVAIGTIART